MTNIDNNMKIIKHLQKLLLFDNTGVWVKNDDSTLLMAYSSSLMHAIIVHNHLPFS